MTRLVITSAQNYTQVFSKGLKTLENYCNHNNAELIVLPFIGKDRKEIKWSPKLSEYLFDHSSKLGQNLDLGTEIPINFQASDPVAGFENVSQSRSLIVPGTRHRLKVVPVQRNALPKVIMSTPCITKPNYRESLVGWKAEKLHQYGAIYVEYEDNGTKFHFRQLTIHPRTGLMYDLNKYYTPSKVGDYNPVALVMGDTHVPNHDHSVFDAKFDKDGLVSKLSPQSLVWHDLLDFTSASHHIKGNHQKYAKNLSLRNDVQKELNEVAEVLSLVKEEYDIPQYIVASNHNDHLTKWLDGDVPTDKNAKIWYWLNHEICKRVISQDKDIIPLEIFCDEYLGDTVGINFLSENDSLVVGGYELAIHGHFGANGAKGGIKSFHNMGVPSITGHTHTPQIYNGSICVGTNSKLDMGYNKGLSSWLHSDCLVYPYGASLINYIDGEWEL